MQKYVIACDLRGREGRKGRTYSSERKARVTGGDTLGGDWQDSVHKNKRKFHIPAYRNHRTARGKHPNLAAQTLRSRSRE